MSEFLCRQRAKFVSGPMATTCGASGGEVQRILGVIIGATPEGQEGAARLVDGARESTDDWRALLSMSSDGACRWSTVAVAGAALGFWKATGEVCPKTCDNHSGFRLGPGAGRRR